jgi:hypothetical protein
MPAFFKINIEMEVECTKTKTKRLATAPSKHSSARVSLMCRYAAVTGGNGKCNNGWRRGIKDTCKPILVT